MKKIKYAYFMPALLISIGILFTFNTPVEAKTMNSSDSLVSDYGDGFLVHSPNPQLKGFWLKLTEEQRQELRAAIRELKDQGATPQQIKDLIHEYLKEWGIKSYLKKKMKKGFWLKLTKKQKRELLQGIKDLKKSGATRKEIKAYIKAMLIEWGIWQKK